MWAVLQIGVPFRVLIGMGAVLFWGPKNMNKGPSLRQLPCHVGFMVRCGTAKQEDGGAAASRITCGSGTLLNGKCTSPKP